MTPNQIKREPPLPETNAALLFDVCCMFAATYPARGRGATDPIAVFDDMRCLVDDEQHEALRQELIEVWREKKQQLPWHFRFV